MNWMAFRLYLLLACYEPIIGGPSPPQNLQVPGEHTSLAPPPCWSPSTCHTHPTPVPLLAFFKTLLKLHSLNFQCLPSPLAKLDVPLVYVKSCVNITITFFLSIIIFFLISSIGITQKQAFGPPIGCIC